MNAFDQFTKQVTLIKLARPKYALCSNSDLITSLAGFVGRLAFVVENRVEVPLDEFQVHDHMLRSRIARVLLHLDMFAAHNGFSLRQAVISKFNEVSERVGFPERLGPDVDFATIRETNVSRCSRWHNNDLNSWSHSDWMTALIGELGELAGVVKMFNREAMGFAGNKFEPTLRHLQDEAADVYMYLDLLSETLSVRFQDIIAPEYLFE